MIINNLDETVSMLLSKSQLLLATMDINGGKNNIVNENKKLLYIL